MNFHIKIFLRHDKIFHKILQQLISVCVFYNTAFGTPYLNEEDVPIGPTFDPDGVPENIWYLSSTTSLYLECLAIGNPQPVYRWLRGTTDSTITEEVDTHLW